MYFFFTTPNQLTDRERISPQRCEKVFAEFPLHIPALYGSTPYLLKNETVVQLSVSQTRYNLDLQIQMQRFISQ